MAPFIILFPCEINGKPAMNITKTGVVPICSGCHHALMINILDYVQTAEYFKVFQALSTLSYFVVMLFQLFNLFFYAFLLISPVVDPV
jgi:hypothetical protein